MGQFASKILLINAPFTQTKHVQSNNILSNEKQTRNTGNTGFHIGCQRNSTCFVI